MTGVSGSFAGRLQQLRTSHLTSRHPIAAAFPSSRFWCAAIVVVAGTLSLAARADAAVYYSDDDSGYSRPILISPPRAQKPKRHSGKAVETKVKDAAKPQGPLIISISISHQDLKLYDANGLYAQTPVSTGMAGHATPMGAFSVIQKQKFHKSNIYSGAPMPFMQRITWSGIAMHAGVLPGYPASHGCIRMPMAFAVKMYNWTRMGARVVVTPGELSPTSFSHPLLVTQKVAPQPVATVTPKPDPTVKGDKVASADPVATPATPATALELRSTVGHDAHLPAVMAEPAAPTPLNQQTHTADAGNASAAKMPATMSDAAPAGPQVANQADKPADAPKSDAAKAAAADDTKAASAPATDGAKTDDKAVAPAPASDASDANKDQARPSDPAAAPKPALAMAKGSGPISVFISRKDSKLYVRQNFAPLFDVPVTIAPSDRPLGTHIFTAEASKTDPNSLSWSVVTLPALRKAERHDEDERISRRRKLAGAAEIAKPLPVPDSPTEALDRLTIPPDAMERITEALSTGGSIIVSDQGIAAGETGEGTDFIVSLR
jgi:lipoprotein-anchoring transpeptidase ErfK/SrfK